jgi:polygalacturonase
LIVLTRVKNLVVRDLTIQNAAKFHFVPTECDDVLITNVTFLAPEHAANTDAIDPSVCRRVTITKCLVDVGDDNVAVKSGKRLDGREFAVEDLWVTDCVFKHGHGMSIGSETVGGVKNVFVKNVSFQDTDNGIRIKSYRGKGGAVENLVCENITMKDVQGAITITTYYPNQPTNATARAATREAAKLRKVMTKEERDATTEPTTYAWFPTNDVAQAMTDETPRFKNITIKNLKATSTKAAGVIVGLPESPVENILLENVEITAPSGLIIRNAKGVRLKNVKINAKNGEPFLVKNAEVEGLPDAKDKPTK